MKSTNIKFFLSGILAAGLMQLQNASALTVTVTTSDNGFPAHLVQWTDSAGLPRSAVMVDQTNTAPYTGYLRRYSYQPTNGQTRVCTGTDNYPSSGTLEFAGDGFVQNHTASDGDFSSGDGNGVTGTTTITLQGASHAIITYSMPTYEIDGPYYNPVNHKTIPTTVQWFFADGRDHPIFAISQDASQGGGNLGADSRSPYGDISYDGDGTDSFVGGCSYGDTYQFITLATSEVTTNSGWDYTTPNTIPFAMQWADTATANAEFGHVATLPILVSDAGQDSQYFNGNATTSESFYEDNRDTDSVSPTTGPMINDQTWAYQIFSQNPIWPPGEPNEGIQSHRVTWGANWGRVGGFDGFAAADNGNSPVTPDSENTNYTQHSSDPVGNPINNQYKGVGNSADGTLMAYSVFVVFGLHNGSYASGVVARQVAQMENVAKPAVLTASIGMVATTGPAGVGNATNRTITYSPAGFNPTYAAWEIAAATNTANATLTPSSTSYPLDQPVFVIDGYTSAQLPASISVNGSTATSNYFASVDTNGQHLWITVNRVISNALNLIVTAPAGGALAPVITSFTPTNGEAGTSVTITGTSFTGATAVAFHGTSATNFEVNSATNISASVPVGATTGTISVTTPGGTATSTEAFTIVSSNPPPTTNYTITVTASPSNGGTVSAGGTNGGGTFAAGSTNTAAAMANSGYTFVNWKQGGTVVSTSTNYTFILNSNVTLVANFNLNAPVDYSLTVSASPTDGGTVTGGGSFAAGTSQSITNTANSGFEFTGWSGDASGTSNPLTVTMTKNLNITANFTAIASGITLTLITNLPAYGTVTVSPKPDDGQLEEGKEYTFTATAKAGDLFSNWSGSVSTNKNPLTIKAESNIVLEANFIPNPFLPFVGKYNGLFTANDGVVTEATSGMIKELTLTSKGTYSGSLLFAGANKAFSGSFDLGLNASNSIKIAGETLALTMSLSSGDSAELLTGTLSGSNWTTTNLSADLATNTLPSAEYTMLILPDTDNSPPVSSPGGDGYALITNSAGTAKDPAAATAKITGALADGTSFSQTVPVSQDGRVPIYTSLYGGKGLLLGWLNLESPDAEGVGLTWIHPGTRSGLYTNGFTNVLSAGQIQISQWENPGNFSSLIDLSELDTIYDISPITNAVVGITDLGKVSGPSVHGTISLKTGLLTVTIGKTTAHGAILVEGESLSGGGYFLTKTNAGAVNLGP